MASYRYPIIAHEGRAYIYAAAVVAIAVHYFIGWLPALLAWALVALLLLLFRDPARPIPANPLGIVCPIDGKVLAVEERHDERLDREALYIRLDMVPWGVFAIRTPSEGKIMEQWFPPRSFGGKGQYSEWIRTDEGDDVVIAFNNTLFVNYRSCLQQIGERTGQGHRCGYVPLGTEVELWLPVSSRPLVKVGDQVKSGIDVVANLVHA